MVGKTDLVFTFKIMERHQPPVPPSHDGVTEEMVQAAAEVLCNDIADYLKIECESIRLKYEYDGIKFPGTFYMKISGAVLPEEYDEEKLRLVAGAMQYKHQSPVSRRPYIYCPKLTMTPCFEERSGPTNNSTFFKSKTYKRSFHGYPETVDFSYRSPSPC